MQQAPYKWTHAQLINYLSKSKNPFIKSDELLMAFTSTNRAKFVIDEWIDSAHLDKTLPIGFGQHISRPSTNAQKLELLKIQPQDKVLQIGAGSGYLSNLIYKLLDDDGLLVSLERIQYLWQLARENSPARRNLVYMYQDALNYKSNFTFNKIISTIIAPELEDRLIDQLAQGGVAIIPTGNHQTKVITKSDEGLIVEKLNDFSDLEFGQLESGLT